MSEDHSILTSASNLHSDIDRFDGKTTDNLVEISARYMGDPEYVSELLSVISGNNPRHQTAGTWLIKRYVEEGKRVEGAEVEALAAASLSLAAFEAQLHVLQIVDRLTLTETSANDLSALAAASLHSHRALLRAWAFDTLVALAEYDERFSDAAALASKVALEDSAASVRARVRRRGVVKRAPFRSIGGANA